ncbi:hypothetical protein Yalta_020 [Yalta virus]|nr:hypothetical protein Yalta_020 [Yalta virus]
MIKLMDTFIQKHYFNNVINNCGEDLVQEIKTEINNVYKDLDKDIKKVYKDNEIGIIEINIIDVLKKKEIKTFENIFDISPLLSYILQEDLYNKQVNYDQKIIDKCSNLEMNSNLIFVSTYDVAKKIKSIIKDNKIKRAVYFKNDFKTPIEYMIYEYNMLLGI